MVDTITTTAITVGKASLTGVSVHAFTPLMFVILIMVIAVAVVVYKFGPKLFPKHKRESSCLTCFKIVTSINDNYRSRIEGLRASVLPEQLNYAALIFSSIESKLISLYKKSLDALMVDNHRQRDEISVYRAFLHNETIELKSFVELRLRQNHILQYSRTQFSTYANEVCDKIITDTRLQMCEKWSDFFSVPLAMNVKEVDLIIDQLKHDIISIFTTAYDIGEKKNTEIEKLEKEYSDALNTHLDDVKKGRI